MNYNDPLTNTSGVVKYSCCIIFTLFCFLYLYFIKGEVLAEAQFVFSQGKTSYSILIGAIIVTFILKCIHSFVSFFVKIPSRWWSLTFFPSLLILTILTDINESTLQHFSFGLWILAAPILFISWLLLCISINAYYKKFENEYRQNITDKLWVNYLILFVMLLTTGSVPQLPDSLHYEWKVERLVADCNYEEAARVGEKSMGETLRLTQLRNFALAMNGKLPELLFTFPQNYGAKGLIDFADTTKALRVTPMDLCYKLGALPGKNIKDEIDYLKRFAEVDSISNKAVIDMYLCSYLLNCDLDKFREALPIFYTIEADSLPKAYREAVMLTDVNESDSVVIIKSVGINTIENFEEYNKCVQQINLVDGAENYLRRNFGDTYWWYYRKNQKSH